MSPPFVTSRPASPRSSPRILTTNVATDRAVYGFAMARRITEVRAASSAAVYPAFWAVQDDALPLDLNDGRMTEKPPTPGRNDGAKSPAELWRRRAGVHTISFRLTNPYGPLDTLDEAEAHVATAFVMPRSGRRARVRDPRRSRTPSGISYSPAISP